MPKILRPRFSGCKLRVGRGALSENGRGFEARMTSQPKRKAERTGSRGTAASGLRISLHTFSGAASALAVLVGCLVLAGWVFGVDVLKRIVPGFVAMNPATALAFVMAGASLWLLRTDEVDRRSRRIAQVLASVVVLAGLLKLVGTLAGWEAGIDQLLFREKLEAEAAVNGVPNRMSLSTAMNFVVLGCALLLMDRRTREDRYPAQYLALAAGAGSLLALVSYAYGAEDLSGVLAYVPMALHTALVFVVLAAGLLCARPDRGPMAIVTTESLGGVMARRLLPAALLVPVVLGWLRLEGQRAGLYDNEFGVALFAVVTALIMAALVWWSAGLVYRTDAERKRAEEARSRLASIAENSNDAIDSKTLDGTIVSLNASAERL